MNETGLPNSQVWELNVTGELPVISSSTTAWLNLTNGTYSYSIWTPNSIYHPTLAGGVLDVQGGAVFQEVDFVPTTYALVFVESGLPPATNWSVILNGAFLSSLTSTLTFHEVTNGSYAYEVDLVPGLVASPSQGTVQVVGPPAGTISVIFQPHVAIIPGSKVSQNSMLLVELVGVIAAAAVLISWVVWRRIRRKPEEDWFAAP
jgi:hypothetical protein